jgi:hypothetical protein
MGRRCYADCLVHSRLLTYLEDDSMSKPLSPTALDIDDAAHSRPSSPRAIAAAALRAASGRTGDLIAGSSHPKFVEGVLAAAGFLERIATELEAPNA